MPYKTIIRVMVVLLAACAFFIAGFLLRGNAALVDRLGMASADSQVLDTTGKDLDQTAVHLGEVFALISENSTFERKDTEQEDLINAFLETTGDPLARYFSPERYNSYIELSASTEYPGIGVLFAEYHGKAYAVDVFEDSAAAAAGVRSGDFVLAIDGDDAQDWSASEVVAAIGQKHDANITIRWRRADVLSAEGGKEFETVVQVKEYDEPNVAIQRIDEVGYISLSQFSMNSDELVRNAIEQLTKEGATSFVLDLRDNPGGYLSKAVDVASLFIKSGTIVQINSTNNKTTTKNATGNIATTAPLVVLINGNTAGSAEVVAAALRDTERARLVGTPTMGHAAVQMISPLSFGGAIRYSAATYASPNGTALNGVGVSADITVAMKKDILYDYQKEAAIEAALTSSRN
ncbi:MAG: PDZ domain-containing protein [Eggerthellaceae bacterium]|nr:PDZ domain-containing protein [Eggerthellaceae bacterium]